MSQGYHTEFTQQGRLKHTRVVVVLGLLVAPVAKLAMRDELGVLGPLGLAPVAVLTVGKVLIVADVADLRCIHTRPTHTQCVSSRTARTATRGTLIRKEETQSQSHTYPVELAILGRRAHVVTVV